MAHGSKRVVYAASAGNLLVTLTKFAAAASTGSAAMLSEAIHSLVDTANQLMLIYGLYRAARPPDEQHPLGYGREIYFWSFIVALFMLTIGAGVSCYEGVQRITHPEAITNTGVSYLVLAFSAVFEGATLVIALRSFRRAKGSLGYFEAVRKSKNPPVFIVLFEDSAALIGLFIALVGTFLSEYLADPIYDGAASIGISALLFVTALILAYESKELLIGEQASPNKRHSIRAIAAAEPGVESARVLISVHLAPDQIVIALGLEFRDDLTTPRIEKIVKDIERKIRKAHPDVVAVFAKPQSHDDQATQPTSRIVSLSKGKTAASPTR